MSSVIYGLCAPKSAICAGMLATTFLVVKFWRHTSGVFFQLFAFAFVIDTVSRAALGLTHVSNDVEPAFHPPRLAVSALIIAAVTVKNRSH